MQWSTIWQAAKIIGLDFLLASTKPNSMHKQSPYILLVDDDIDDRYLMSASFAEIGWSENVKLIESSIELINYLHKLPEDFYPSLIVLDYNMPKCNGAETLALLKKESRFRDIAVAIYSSHMNTLLENSLKLLGATACFPKSFSPSKTSELVQALKKIAEEKTIKA